MNLTKMQYNDSPAELNCLKKEDKENRKDTGVGLETPLLKESEELDERKPLVGAVLALLASIFFTLAGLIVQKYQLNFADGLLARYSFQSVILIGTMIHQKYGLKQITFHYDYKLVTYLLFQSVFNAIGHSAEIVCFNFMPIGDATTIMMSNPIPVMILSRIFLDQKIRLFKLICGAVVYTGLVFVVQPSFVFKNSFAR